MSTLLLKSGEREFLDAKIYFDEASRPGTSCGNAEAEPFGSYS